jgi:hemerythrin superfamily protein
MSNVIERAVARAVAKVGGAQATARGLRGVFRRLTEEHKAVSSLLRRLAMSSDIDDRAHIWPSVRDELIAHERAESQEVYSDVEWHPSLIDIVQAHEEDAGTLQSFLRELDSLTFDSPHWQPTLLKLEAVVNAHAEREEELFFPKVQSIIGEDRAEELDSRYLDTKNAIRGAA